MKKLFIFFSLACISLAYEINSHQKMTYESIKSTAQIPNLEKFVQTFQLQRERYENELYKDQGVTYEEKTNVLYREVHNINFVSLIGGNGYLQLIEEGAILEDLAEENPFGEDQLRVVRHFYDPVHNSGIAGFSTSKAWAKSESGFSWNDAIQDYKQAIAGTSYAQRHAAQAHLFVSLGHVVHLVQDVHQPSHTRNDPHTDRLGDGSSALEVWGSKEYHGRAHNGGISRVVPVQEPSFDDYFTHSAEYSNYNFYSDDSFHEYPSPTYVVTSTEPQPNSGYNANCSASGTQLIESRNLESSLLGYYKELKKPPPVIGGHNCARKYELVKKDSNNSPNYHVIQRNAKELIPRAIGATQGLINHFFRGQIEIVSVSPCGIIIKNNGPMLHKVDGQLSFYADDGNTQERKTVFSTPLEYDLATGQEMVLKGVDPSVFNSLNIDIALPFNMVLLFDGMIGSEKGVAATQKSVSYIVRAAQPEPGPVSVSLDWNSSNIDLDIVMEGWEQVGDRDIKSEVTGCPSEHYVIKNNYEIKEGTYYAGIKLKDPGSNTDISETISMKIGVLNEDKAFSLTVNEVSELDVGKVARIDIKYIDGKPSIKMSSLPSHLNIIEIESPPFVTVRSCAEQYGPYNCGCMRCEVKIIPYLQQALAGPLSGADIELHIASEFENNTPLFRTQASTGLEVTSAGIISIPKSFTNELSDNELYIIHARGGRDIDSNDDFVNDGTETINRGSLHAVIDGKSLKSYGYKLNVLTEIAYQNIKGDIGVISNQVILAKLDEITTLLMNRKIDAESNASLAYSDLITWLPSFDKPLLFHNYDEKLEPIVQKIYRDENITQDAIDVVYGKSLFPRVQSEAFELYEDMSTGSYIGKLSILDEGESPIEAFELLGDGNENFRINEKGEIYLSDTAVIDFEVTRAYNLTVLTNNGNNTGKSAVNFYVRDVLDAPVVTGFEGEAVFSNAAPLTHVAKVTFNPGNSPITEMILEGNGNQYFDIDLDGNIRVSSIGLHDILYTSNFAVNIKAKNASGYSYPFPVSLHVIKVSQAPSLKHFVGYIDEHAKGGVLVGQVSFAEGGSPIDAFVLTGDGSENFTIDLSGEIRVKAGAVIDYETTSYYRLGLSARNAQGTSLGVFVQIVVNDLEDVPVLKHDHTFNLDEGVSSEDIFIGNILETVGLGPINDINVSNNKFKLDGEGNLYLKANEALDYESATREYIKVSVANDFGTSIQRQYTINVQDIEDVPTLVSMITNIPENSPAGTIAGTISFTQGTSPIESMQFQPTSDLFDIDLKGVIRVKEGAILDYETKVSHVLFVYATNASGNSLAVRVTINLGNQLDAPELKNITHTVEENSQGFSFPDNIINNEGLSNISEIKVFNSDNIISSIVYADINGTVHVRNTADLDYEKGSRLDFTAIAYNNEGPSRPADITLDLINVLDAPELSALSAYIDENATVGTVVGQISFNPGLSPVRSMNLYSAKLGQANPFRIDEKGEITLNGSLDYEKITRYTLVAVATNDQGTSSKSSVIISVNDVLDNPILHNLSTSISEEVLPGGVIGQVVYQEGLDPIDSMVLSGDGSELFTIDKSGTIRLKEDAMLDYEQRREYHLLAQAFSARYISNIIDVDILIDDADEIAQAGIGLWGGSTVNIYKLEDNGSKTLMFTELTSASDLYEDTGLFDSHRLELDQNSYYLYEVSGGEEYDANKDGILDLTPTINTGTLHTYVKGAWVRHMDTRFSISMMNELAYQVSNEYVYRTPEIILTDRLQEVSSKLFNESINLDGEIDYSDLFVYSASRDQYKLKEGMNSKLMSIEPKVYANESIYDDAMKLLYLADNMESLNIDTTDTLGQASIVFDSTTDMSTISKANFILKDQNGQTIDATVIIEGNRVTVTPVNSLAIDQTYIFVYVDVITKTGTDRFGQPIEYEETIELMDYNFYLRDLIAPAVSTNPMQIINENSVGRITILAEDESELTYAVIGGEDSDQVYITEGFNNLYFRQPGLDYENPRDADKDNVYKVDVAVVDAFGNKTVINFEISVANIVEPPVISTHNFTIDENVPINSYVGKLTISQEGDSQIVGYEVNSDMFSINADGEIYTLADLNYEKTVKETFTARATTQSGISSNSFTVNITINDLIEYLPEVYDYTSSMEEVAQAGQIVGKVSYYAGYDGNLTAFTLTGEGASNFDINLNGEISVSESAELLDANISTYRLSIEATNGYGTSEPASLIIYMDKWSDQFGANSAYSSAGRGCMGTDSVFVLGTTDANFEANESQSSIYTGYLARYTLEGDRTWIVSDDRNNYTYNSCSVDGNGNVHVSGSYSANGGYGVFISTYDAQGNRIWDYAMDPSSKTSEGGITFDVDGNIYLAGTTYTDLTGDGLKSRRDAFIRKLDINGNELWTREFGGSKYMDVPNIVVSSSNEVYIIGNDSYPNYMVYLRKYNTDGDLVWNKEFYHYAGSRDITLDTNGDLLVLAHNGLYKYMSDGELAWEKSLNNEIYETALGISSNNEIFYTGISSITNGDNSVKESGTGYGRDDFAVVKLSAEGDQVYLKQFGSIYDDFPTTLLIDGNDDIYISGKLEESLDGHIHNEWSYDPFIMRIAP